MAPSHLTPFNPTLGFLVLLQVTAPLSAQCYRGTQVTHCKFYHSFCNWTTDHWKVDTYTHNLYTFLDTGEFHNGSLWSPPICSTRWQKHCLHFTYTFHGQSEPKAELQVVLDVKDKGTIVVWKLADTSEPEFDATVPIKTTAEFKIMFSVEKPSWYNPGVGSYVSVTNINYEEKECIIHPPDATATSAQGPRTTVTSKPTFHPSHATATSAQGPRTTVTSRPNFHPSHATATAAQGPRTTVTSRRTIHPPHATATAAQGSRTTVTSRPTIHPPHATATAAQGSRTTVTIRPTTTPPTAGKSTTTRAGRLTRTSSPATTPGSSGIIIGTVVGVVVIVIVVVVVVVLIVAKRRNQLCFRRDSVAAWKPVQFNSNQYVDFDTDQRTDTTGVTGQPPSAPHPHPQPAAAEADTGNRIYIDDGGPHYSTPDHGHHTSTPIPTPDVLPSILPPVYALVNKTAKGGNHTSTPTPGLLPSILPPVYALVNKTAKGGNKLLERRRSSHQLQTLPLVRTTGEQAHGNADGHGDKHDDEKRNWGTSHPGQGGRRSSSSHAQEEEEEEGRPAIVAGRIGGGGKHSHAVYPEESLPTRGALEAVSGSSQFHPRTRAAEEKEHEEQYTCLDFTGKAEKQLKADEEGRRGGSGEGEVYDHLRVSGGGGGGGEEDMYSRVQREPKTWVVLDQVYSHLQ